MKNIKRILALVLALAMVLSMSAVVFAGEADGEPEPGDDTPTSYTITAPSNGHTYDIYQIFTGDFANSQLNSIKWGANGTGTTDAVVATDVLTALIDANAEGTSDTAKLAVIEQYANLSGQAFATIKGDTRTASVPGGYYLIKDQDGTVPAGDAYTLYVVQVADNVTFTAKGDVPEVEKTIVEDTAEAEKNNAAIGDTVSYKIVGTLPSNLDEYNEYYYVFKDTLSEGLDYNNDVNITVTLYDEEGNDETFDATKYFYKGTGNSANDLVFGIQDILQLNNLDVEPFDDGYSVTKDSEITVTYSATVNALAAIGTDPNTNEVVIDFYNDPNHSGDGNPTTPPEENPGDEPTPGTNIPTGETPKSETMTYVTELQITKTDEAGKPLTGATFTLSGTNLNKVNVVTYDVFTADDDGTYYKLADGTYTEQAPIEETTYVKLDAWEEGCCKLDNDAYVAAAETDEGPFYRQILANKDLYDATDLEKGTMYKKTAGTKTLTEADKDSSVTATVDENGLLTFSGLSAGTYTLTETVAPTGYNKIEPIEFEITFADGTFSTTSTDVSISNNVAAITVVNQSGTELPETGGIGTTIFYVLGGILLAGAAVLLVTKKRMSSAA